MDGLIALECFALSCLNGALLEFQVYDLWLDCWVQPCFQRDLPNCLFRIRTSTCIVFEAEDSCPKGAALAKVTTSADLSIASCQPAKFSDLKMS